MSLLPWTELWGQIGLRLELKNGGRSDSEGWVSARCINPGNHKNGDSKFSMRINTRSGGVRCMSQGCPVGPNLNNLAEQLGIDARRDDDWRGGSPPEDPVRRLAEERLLPEEALRVKYGIHGVRGGWAFPVDDPDASQPHLKRDPQRWPDEGAPKNWWRRAGVKASDFVYGLSHVDQGSEAVYIAAGEVDCITLLEAGFPAVTFLAGEWTTPTTKAMRKLIDHGISAICFVYDVDRAGREGAPKVSEACVREGLQVHIVSLPDDLGEGGDINDLWVRCDGDPAAFNEALQACPMTKVDGRKPLGSESPSTFVRTFSEFLETAEAQPTEYLVAGLFPAGWLLGLAGKPRVGKSLLALHLARCVATGQPFLGRDTKQGPVFYLALEDPVSLVMDRITALGDVPAGYIHVGPWSDALREEMERDVRQIKPVLIILDPLVSTYGTSVQDESDNAQLAAHMTRLYALGHEVGASVLCIHHLRKADGPIGDTIRGGGAILAATHCMVVAKGEPDRLKLTFLTKTQGIDPMTIALGDGLTWRVAEQEAKQTSSGDMIIFGLRELKKATAEELAEFLGMKLNTVQGLLRELRQGDRVVQLEKQGRTPVYGEKSNRERQVPLSSLVPGGANQETGGVD